MNPQELEMMLMAQGGQPPVTPEGVMPQEAVPMSEEEMLMQMMGGGQMQGGLPPEMAMAMQQMQQQKFKQVYGMTDEDFEQYGFRRLVKEAAQSNLKKVRLTDWKSEPSLMELKHDFIHAQSHQSKYLGQLNQWQELYEAPKFGKKDHKGSRVNPKLIRKQAEWNAPSLSEPFLSTSNLFDVKPLSFEDVPRAKQNALILNRQFNTQLNKVSLVDGVIRQLVKNGSCIIRMGWEYQEKMVKQKLPLFTYTSASVEELEMVEQQLAEVEQLQATEPDSYDALPDEVKAGYEMSVEKGIPFTATPAGFTEKEVKKVVVNRPTVEICNIKNVYIDPTCKGNFDNAQFVIHNYESSISELKKQGIYENLGYLQEHQGTSDSTLDKPEDSGFRFQDIARRKLTVHEYWGYWDIDGDGTTKAIVATWVGDVLIRMEENPFPNGKLPFVVFNYLPEEDSVFGVPNAELLGDNQQILGAVTRGMIDLMGKSANSQTGFSKNFLDAANKVKFSRGMDYEYNNGFDPRVHVHTHKYPEIPNSAMAMVQMMNNEAESLSGVKAFSGTGISASNLGDVAAGVRGVLDAVSKREMSILRRVSEGFISMGRFIIAMNSEFLSEKEVVRVTNKEFVTVRRDDLAGDFDLTLSISTAEGDENKAQQLAFLLQTIGNSMGNGLTQLILSEIAHLRKMPDLANTIENYQEEPDEMQQQMAELQLQKLQAEVELLQAEAQEAMAKAQVQGAKVGVEEARAASLQGDADNKALDFVERDSGTRHSHEMDKQALINQGITDREALKQGATMAALDKKNQANRQAQVDKHNHQLLQRMAGNEMDMLAQAQQAGFDQQLQQQQHHQQSSQALDNAIQGLPL